MSDVLLTCGKCHARVEIRAESAVLPIAVAPIQAGELLFRCPLCATADIQLVDGDALAQLLIAGIRPLALSEPTLTTRAQESEPWK